jgi:hypothetical protein
METAKKFDLPQYMMEQVAKASMMIQLAKAKPVKQEKLKRGHPTIYKTDEERRAAMLRSKEKYKKKKQQEKSIERLKVEFMTLGSEQQTKLIAELIAMITM